MPEVNRDKFQEAYARALDRHVEEAEEDRATHASRGFTIPSIGDVGDYVETGCEAWSKYKSYLNMALGMLGFISPGASVSLRALFTAIDQTIMPAICGSEATSTTQPPGQGSR